MCVRHRAVGEHGRAAVAPTTAEPSEKKGNCSPQFSQEYRCGLCSWVGWGSSHQIHRNLQWQNQSAQSKSINQFEIQLPLHICCSIRSRKQDVQAFCLTNQQQKPVKDVMCSHTCHEDGDPVTEESELLRWHGLGAAGPGTALPWGKSTLFSEDKRVGCLFSQPGLQQRFGKSLATSAPERSLCVHVQILVSLHQDIFLVIQHMVPLLPFPQRSCNSGLSRCPQS